MVEGDDAGAPGADASGSPVPTTSTLTGASTASCVRAKATGRRSSSAIAARTSGRAASRAKRETGAQRMTAVRARSSEQGPSGRRTWWVAVGVGAEAAMVMGGPPEVRALMAERAAEAVGLYG